MRYDELDSIRGLAATSVLLAHISIILQKNYFFEMFRHTPLHILWLGHESVILFFILSGFVLSLPFVSKRQLFYGDYLVRRICRIYLPSVCSVIIAFGLMCIYSGKVEGMSDFFNGIWAESPTSYSLLNNIFLLGELDYMSVNPVLWSLVHEVRISIIFPFIMYLLLRISTKSNIIFMLSIPMLYLLSFFLGLKVFNFDYTAYLSGYSSFILTPYYVGFFVLGALIATNKELIREKYISLSKTSKKMLISLGAVAYLYDWIIVPDMKIIHNFIIGDWIVAFGGSIFIIIALNSKKVGYVLRLRSIHAIGKISYSLYLYHMIVLLTLIYIFYDKLNITIILFLAFIVSFVVASIMYYAVEVPAIKLGRNLTKRSLNGIRRKRMLNSNQELN